MTEYDDFFDNVGGQGAPSLKIKGINDGAIGVVVDQFKTPAKVFGKDEVKKDRDGNEIEQLVVVLQTEYKNWERVAKVPLKDHNDKSKGTKDPSEDDGRRALYIEPWTNIHAAVGKAVKEANAANGTKGGIKTGATLGVKIVDQRDTDKGNPLNIWEAVYTPPEPESPSDGFLNQGGQPAEEKREQKDPWGAPTPAAGAEKPPF